MMNPTLKIAVAQTPGNRLDQWPDAHAAAVGGVEQAADARADLVLLPECVWPAYYIESVDAFRRARRDGMPSDLEFIDALCDLARKRRIAVCAGLVAEHDQSLSNDALLIDQNGHILGRHSKCFLWDFDNEFFTPGQSLQPVSTPWGPIGLMICADARLPEIPATLAARGARLILQPTAWVNVGTPERLWNPQPAVLIPQRARELGVSIASASKWGEEGGVTLVGSSLICDSDGQALAQCGVDASEIITADVTLTPPRKPQIPLRTRERLLAPRPAVPPTIDAPPLRIIRLSQTTTAEGSPAFASDENDAFQNAPTLYITDNPPPDLPHFENSLVLSSPSDVIYECRGVRLAALDAAEASTFAAPRAAALDGVHCIIVFGGLIPADALRCRAVENRVFIVHVAESRTVAYDPQGDEVTPHKPHTIYLQSSQAADKCFAPHTDPFAQRRPAQYEF